MSTRLDGDPQRIRTLRAPARYRPSRRVLTALLGLAALLVAVAASLAVGSREIPLHTVWDALRGLPVPSGDAAAVLDLRLPRTVIGLTAGMALGVSGAVIQAVTRNPLADPGILGVNAGSAFFVSLAVGLLGVTSPQGYLWFAFLGAFVATVIVSLIGAVGRGAASPARLTLAGVALGAVLTGIVSAIRLSDPKSFEILQVWESGSLHDRGWDVAAPVIPFIAAGLLLAALLGPSLNTMALGDDLAASLGTGVLRTRLLAIVAVTLLAGGATAMAGPITFVGLMIPHIARWIVGPDQRWIIGLTVLLSPVLLLASDILARVVLRPGELPVGVVTAIVGAPVLIVLVRRRRVSGL